MTGQSHLMAGALMTAATLHQMGYSQAGMMPLGLAFGVGLIASLLPDVDSQNPMLKSKIKGNGQPQFSNRLMSRRLRQTFPIIVIYAIVAASELLIRYSLSGCMGLVSRLVKHRGPTHYLITPIILTTLIWYVPQPLGRGRIYAVAFAAGYLSHIWCDTMTKSGVRLLAPIVQKPMHSLPWPFRLTTGRTPSLAEMGAVASIGLLCIATFSLQSSHYLPTVVLVVMGMFLLTAVYDHLYPPP